MDANKVNNCHLFLLAKGKYASINACIFDPQIQGGFFDDKKTNQTLSHVIFDNLSFPFIKGNKNISFLKGDVEEVSHDRGFYTNKKFKRCIICSEIKN